MTDIFICECGKTLKLSSKKKHLKSKTHIKNLSIKNGTYTTPERKICKSILEKNDKINCDCGSSYIRKNKARHLKSKTHKRYEKSKKVINTMEFKYLNNIIKFIELHKTGENYKKISLICDDLLNKLIDGGVNNIKDEELQELDILYNDFYALYI